jgi:hypothetical protein
MSAAEAGTLQHIVLVLVLALAVFHVRLSALYPCSAQQRTTKSAGDMMPSQGLRLNPCFSKSASKAKAALIPRCLIT